MSGTDHTSPPDAGQEHSVRLQVLLARCGVASRRHAADLVREGRVQVHGRVVDEPGLRVDPATAHIRVDGKPLRTDAPRRHRTVMLNKPRDLICSADDGQGPTVFECLRGIPGRLVPVGRLDKDSEGLLLLSTDGDLVNRLTHPRYGHRKEYLVTVRGTLDGRALATLRGAMVLDDGTRIRPVEVSLVDSEPRRDPPRHRLLMVLGEGRNRQVRRMCEAVGLYVERLIRLAIGGLRLPHDLPAGKWRDLTSAELALLSRSASPGKDDDETVDSPPNDAL